YYTEPTAPGSTSFGPQEIYVNDSGGTKRCLQVPDLGAGNGDLVFRTCDSSAKQKWTRTKDTGDYASSYLMIDTFGRCMFADPSDPFNTYYSKIRVTACDGSLRQKWNAPAIYEDSTFGGYREIAR
ncbi:MAG: hypothetical protein LH624_03000, partial [Cryobacterium sp.]|nr:hypothetical protein [Cryobacterium sp.]